MRAPLLPSVFRSPIVLAALLSAGFVDHGWSQVVLGQVDDFESGVSGWMAGLNISAAPSIAPDLGPGGAGDDALFVQSFGGGGPGSMLVTFNQAQWTGDFLAAGVTAVRLDLNNLTSEPLTIRIALGTPGDAPFANWYASSVGFSLAGNSGWTTATLSLGPGDLELVGGSGSYEDVMSNVGTMRILHSASPDFRADAVVANLLIDNITAVPEPAAVATPMALIALGLGLWLRKGAKR